jgi:hypothetical protein
MGQESAHSEGGRLRGQSAVSKENTTRAGKTQLSLRGDWPNMESNSPKIISPVMIAPIHMATPTFSRWPTLHLTCQKGRRFNKYCRPHRWAAPHSVGRQSIERDSARFLRPQSSISCAGWLELREASHAQREDMSTATCQGRPPHTAATMDRLSVRLTMPASCFQESCVKAK